HRQDACLRRHRPPPRHGRQRQGEPVARERCGGVRGARSLNRNQPPSAHIHLHPATLAASRRSRRMKPLAVVLALALAASPALAGPTARVSGGDIAVRTGPGHGYRVMGRLPDGAEVTLDYCTRNDRWCFVTGTGWVDASWLVGWSAKMRVTPPDFSGPGWKSLQPAAQFATHHGLDHDQAARVVVEARDVDIVRPT